MVLRTSFVVARTVTVTALMVFVVPASLLAASTHAGRVTFDGGGVPGATVTASRGDRTLVTTTDLHGGYRFTDLEVGVWVIHVEMRGFAALRQEVIVGADSPPALWVLTLLPIEEIAGVLPAPVVSQRPAVADARSPRNPARGEPSSAIPQAAVVATGAGMATAVQASSQAGTESSTDTGDAFLINGSVNNAAASPYALPLGFGNNRPGSRSQYSWAVGTLFGTSALDSRPFSFTNQSAAKPEYNNMHTTATFGGPVRIPTVQNRMIVFAAYQRLTDDNTVTQTAVVPTALERRGDFSRLVDAGGSPVQITDPLTGEPFAGNRIPAERLSPQAQALLRHFPLPTGDDTAGYNYQVPVLNTSDQHTAQIRLSQSPTPLNHLSGILLYNRAATGATDVFGFTDKQRTTTLDTTVSWLHQFSQQVSLRFQFQYTRAASKITPHFAFRNNVSGEAGITGNNQDPEYWGPPNLRFSRVTSMTSAQYADNREDSYVAGSEMVWARDRHTFTFGGDIRRQLWDVYAQQDARGTLAFTGAASGSDLADFLLGIPQTSAIAFGNPDKQFRALSYDAYVADDWRISPGLTINAGVRWEYEAPLTEAQRRIVNLDIAPGFSAAAPVSASSPTGATTGARYPESLVRPDKRGIQPRVSAAWRPLAASSLVIRAGYGVYRNTDLYYPLATLLAQQPPLSTTMSVETSEAFPLVLDSPFILPPGVVTPNTFAVDPNFRVGFAHSWQLMAQRDLAGSVSVTASYLGTKGSHLIQAFLPNTFAPGAIDPCSACPRGFVYLTSNGTSIRHAGSLQLRRRLRNGFTATARYTLAHAMDDAAAAFGGSGLGGAAVAQNWLDLDAEYAPSAFDQRHQLTAQFLYTRAGGLRPQVLGSRVLGTLLAGWTVNGQLTVGSGLPWTPVLLAPVGGSGVTGVVRPHLTGRSVEPVGDSVYVNPEAFGPPPAGQWGSAGRNSLTGPAQFLLNAGVSRSFQMGSRMSLEWRVDVTNLLNRVTYSDVHAVFGGQQFGYPRQANPMRRLRTGLRLRFNMDRR